MICQKCGHDLTCIDIGITERNLVWGHDVALMEVAYKNGYFSSATSSNLQPDTECHQIVSINGQHCLCREPTTEMCCYCKKNRIKDSLDACNLCMKRAKSLGCDVADLTAQEDKDHHDKVYHQGGYS